MQNIAYYEGGVEPSDTSHRHTAVVTCIVNVTVCLFSYLSRVLPNIDSGTSKAFKFLVCLFTSSLHSNEQGT